MAADPDPEAEEAKTRGGRGRGTPTNGDRGGEGPDRCVGTTGIRAKGHPGSRSEADDGAPAKGLSSPGSEFKVRPEESGVGRSVNWGGALGNQCGDLKSWRKERVFQSFAHFPV